MNHPHELLPLNTKLTTTHQLQSLLSDGTAPLEVLDVEGEAVDFELLAAVIKRNCHSLKKIIITGRNTKVSSEPTQGFPVALEMCTELTFLAIRNFSHYLADVYPTLLKNLNRLTKLMTLDIRGCALCWWENALDDLANNNTITELYLNNALDDDQWVKFSAALSKNRTLQKIDFGESALSLLAVTLLMRVITTPQCTITEIEWSPKDFYSNEQNRFLAYFNTSDRWAWRNYQEQLNAHNERLNEFKQTGKHFNLNKFQEAQSLLQQLQNFLTEKRRHRPKTELVIEIPNEKRVIWEHVSGQILLHAKALQHLTVRFLNLETGCPILDGKTAQVFLNALQQCKHLQTLNMENFMGVLFTLSEEHFVALFKILKDLPLKKLSFNRTYIGPVGIEHLKSILSAGKVTEIDLTFAAIVTESSVKELAQGISSCRSLQTVILGTSPLTLGWWQMLDNSVQHHPNRPALAWKPTDESVMSTKMEIFTACLPDYMVKDMAPSEGALRYIILNKFRREISGIEQKWEQLQAQTQTEKSSSTPSPFWSDRTKKEGSEMEMSVLPTNPNTPLLQRQAAKAKSYGSSS